MAAYGQANPRIKRGSGSELHRSFVGSRPLRVRLRFLRMTAGVKVNVGVKIKINVKGDGQECPSHTGRIKIKVKSSGRGRPLYIFYANSRPSGWRSRCQASR